MDKISINQRFIEAVNNLLQDKGLTKAGIAANLGVKPAKFSEILNNRMMAGTDMIASLCEQFSYSPIWLLVGEGPMLIPGYLKGRSKPAIALEVLSEPIPEDVQKELKRKVAVKMNTISAKKKNNNTKEEKAAVPCDSPNGLAHPAQSPKEGIPLIPFSAMAGVLKGEQTALEYECEHYVVPAFSGADFLMTVKGNSMMPTYLSGDIVACQRVPMSGLFFQWNKPYVLDTNQGAIIKRIKPGSDKQHVLLVSDNTDYGPFELPYEDIYAVALVIGIIRLE